MCFLNRFARLSRAAVMLVLFTTTSSVAQAQTGDSAPPSLAHLLRPGMTVWVTDRAGDEQRVRIVGLDDDTVTGLSEADVVSRLATADIVRIRARRADSVLDGAAIGAGAAIASALFVCTRLEPWDVCRDDVGPMLKIGALGAGIGMAFDALLRDRKTIYGSDDAAARVEIAPMLGGERRGVNVSVRF